MRLKAMGQHDVKKSSPALDTETVTIEPAQLSIIIGHPSYHAIVRVVRLSAEHPYSLEVRKPVPGTQLSTINVTERMRLLASVD